MRQRKGCLGVHKCVTYQVAGVTIKGKISMTRKVKRRFHRDWCPLGDGLKFLSKEEQIPGIGNRRYSWGWREESKKYHEIPSASYSDR